LKCRRQPIEIKIGALRIWVQHVNVCLRQRVYDTGLIPID
jgi:hypothetical protein